MGDEGTPPVSTEAEGTPQHVTDSTTNTPVVANVGARWVGGARLSLSPVPGTRTRMTFAPGGGGGGRRGR
jgi:hypothetical protein